MPGSASERVALAKARDAAKKASRQQRLANTRLAHQQMAAIVLLQCAARRRAAMRLAAAARNRYRTPDRILEERRTEWLEHRRSINRPGYTSSFVSPKLAEQERLRYPWVRQTLTVWLTPIDGSLGIAVSDNKITAVHAGCAASTNASMPMRVGDLITEVNGKSTEIEYFAKLLPKDKSQPVQMRLLRKPHGKRQQAGTSAERPTWRTSFRELSRKQFTSLYVAANLDSTASQHVDAAEVPAKPPSSPNKRDRPPAKNAPQQAGSETPQQEGRANVTMGGSTDANGSVPAAPSMLRRLSSAVRKVSKEAMGLLSA